MSWFRRREQEAASASIRSLELRQEVINKAVQTAQVETEAELEMKRLAKVREGAETIESDSWLTRPLEPYASIPYLPPSQVTAEAQVVFECYPSPKVYSRSGCVDEDITLIDLCATFEGIRNGYDLDLIQIILEEAKTIYEDKKLWLSTIKTTGRYLDYPEPPTYLNDYYRACERLAHPGLALYKAFKSGMCSPNLTSQGVWVVAQIQLAAQGCKKYMRPQILNELRQAIWKDEKEYPKDISIR